MDAILNGALGDDVRGFLGSTADADVAALTLVVAAAAADSAVDAGAIELIDPEGAPVARLDVEGVLDAGEDRRGLDRTRLAARAHGVRGVPPTAPRSGERSTTSTPPTPCSGSRFAAR